MSAKLFQSIILQVKNDLTRDIGVLDATGVVIASSDLRKIGNIDYQGAEFLNSNPTKHYDNVYQIIKGEYGNIQNIVYVTGNDDRACELASVLAASVASINSLYDNKYDKATFVKNILLDNILPGDIYIKSNELNFPQNNTKVVFLIRQVEGMDSSASDIITNFLQNSDKHFVIHISERDIAVVYEAEKMIQAKDVYKIAQNMQIALEEKIEAKIIIGHGSVYESLEEISKSFKEAQIALEVGEVFDSERTIIGFENLGVGRLIYQLPTTLCRMFLSEVFKKGSIDSLDEETLSTIKAFFDNNLNVSETSRKLFVHRNTLVYRLGKIRKITGLDLRKFDHAIVFKVALMVRKYLEARDSEKILF
ncbi:MAG: helix-turn-helix domain-containing protein [Clostridia bacterium]